MSIFKFNDKDSCYKAVGAVYKKAKEYQSQPKPKGVKCNLLIFEIYDSNDNIVETGSINSEEKRKNFTKLVYKTGIGYIKTSYTEHPIPCFMLS